MQNFARPVISAARLRMFIDELAKIGRAPSGGFYREALTDADHAARNHFLKWAQEKGFQTFYDPIGNLFVRLEGRESKLAPVVTGSHLDTQPNGGAHDGVLGVLTGLEALCAIRDSGIQTWRPIEVVVWMNEEGSRFVPGCTGSRAFIAPSTIEEYRRLADEQGVTLGQELDRLPSLTPPSVTSRPLGSPIHRFIELHIEQGPILEGAKSILGVVEGIQGHRRYAVEVIGEPAHSGTTPRRTRKDAFLTSLRIIERLSIAYEDAADALRFTVGKMLVEPNSPFVVPGNVKFWVDIRHPKAEVLEKAAYDFYSICAANAKPCEVRSTVVSTLDPIHFVNEVVDSVEEHARRQQLPWMRIFSGAGHDAQMIHKVCPSAMIFVPCKGGISHSPLEDIDFSHAKAGAQLLADILFNWAEAKETTTATSRNVN